MRFSTTRSQPIPTPSAWSSESSTPWAPKLGDAHAAFDVQPEHLTDGAERHRLVTRVAGVSEGEAVAALLVLTAEGVARHADGVPELFLEDLVEGLGVSGSRC